MVSSTTLKLIGLTVPFLTDWETRKKSYLRGEVSRRREIITRQVLPLRESHHVVHDRPAGKVGWLAAGLEEPGVDTLADDHIGELQILQAYPGLTETPLGKEKYSEEDMSKQDCLTLMALTSCSTTYGI